MLICIVTGCGENVERGSERLKSVVLAHLRVCTEKRAMWLCAGSGSMPTCRSGRRTRRMRPRNMPESAPHPYHAALNDRERPWSMGRKHVNFGPMAGAFRAGGMRTFDNLMARRQELFEESKRLQANR
eukprot:3120352-Rhodomonas_salina.1